MPRHHHDMGCSAVAVTLLLLLTAVTTNSQGKCLWTWTWRHDVETLSALLALCGGIHWSPVVRLKRIQQWFFLFSLFVSLNKLLNIQSSYRWLETSWRLCDVAAMRCSFHDVSNLVSCDVSWEQQCYFLVTAARLTTYLYWLTLIPAWISNYVIIKCGLNHLSILRHQWRNHGGLGMNRHFYPTICNDAITYPCRD